MRNHLLTLLAMFLLLLAWSQVAGIAYVILHFIFGNSSASETATRLMVLIPWTWFCFMVLAKMPRYVRPQRQRANAEGKR